MKKLALAIGLGVFVAFGTSGSALAAYRIDNSPGFSAIRYSAITASVKGANERLLSLNMALYPEQTPDTNGVACAGEICVSAN